MRTIPLMCTACGEIVDVTIPLGESGSGGCPMCGGEFTSDYDLPPQEHVTIEVCTPDRLRIRFPFRVEPFSVADKFAILILNAIFCFLFGLLMHESFSSLVPIRTSRLVMYAIVFVVLVSAVNLLWAVDRWGHRVVEVDHERFAIKTVLGGWSWTRTIPLMNIQEVAYHVVDVIFGLPLDELRYGICTLEERSGNNRLLLAQSPDRARYVAHLLRRQLYALGHKLSDTSDKSAKRPTEKRSALEPVHALR